MDILYKRGYVEYHGSLNANVYISYLYKVKRGYVTCKWHIWEFGGGIRGGAVVTKGFQAVEGTNGYSLYKQEYAAVRVAHEV